MKYNLLILLFLCLQIEAKKSQENQGINSRKNKNKKKNNARAIKNKRTKNIIPSGATKIETKIENNEDKTDLKTDLEKKETTLLNKTPSLTKTTDPKKNHNNNKTSTTKSTIKTPIKTNNNTSKKQNPKSQNNTNSILHSSPPEIKKNENIDPNSIPPELDVSNYKIDPHNPPLEDLATYNEINNTKEENTQKKQFEKQDTYKNNVVIENNKKKPKHDFVYSDLEREDNYKNYNYKEEDIKNLMGDSTKTTFLADKDQLKYNEIKKIDTSQIGKKIKEEIKSKIKSANLSLLLTDDKATSELLLKKIIEFIESYYINRPINIDGKNEYTKEEQNNRNLYGAVIDKIIDVIKGYNDLLKYKDKDNKEKLNNIIIGILQLIENIKDEMIYNDIFLTLKNKENLNLKTNKEFDEELKKKDEESKKNQR